jgi:hypothetical protein
MTTKPKPLQCRETSWVCVPDARARSLDLTLAEISATIPMCDISEMHGLVRQWVHCSTHLNAHMRRIRPKPLAPLLPVWCASCMRSKRFAIR